MKTIAAIGAVLALILPMTALADNSTFQLLVNSAHFDGSQTYTPKRNQPLADVQISLPATVQLDGTVAADLVKNIGGHQDVVSTGAILYSADDAQTTFCSKAWQSFGGMPRVTCLTDKDGDGRFEGGTKYGFVAMMPPNVAMMSDKITGVMPVMDFVTFPNPIPYHRLDASALVPITAGIAWAADYSGQRMQFGFTIAEFGGKQGGWMAGNFFTPFQAVTFDGAPVSIDLYGIKVTVVGVNSDGAPICKLEGAIDHQRLPFTVQNVTVKYIYY